MKTRTKELVEKPLSTESYEDEIDLFKLFLILKKRKNILFIITSVFLVLGILISIFWKFRYKQELVIANHSLEWERILFPENARNNVTNNTINNSLISLLIEEFAGSYQDAKIYAKQDKNDPHRILVTIEAYEISSLSTIKKDLINSIKNHNLYLSKEKAFKNILTLQQKEIQELISKQKKLILSLENSKNIVFGFDVFQSYLQLITREELLKSFESQPILSFSDLPFTDKLLSKRILIISISFITGLLLGIFLALFLDYYEKIRDQISFKDT